MKLVSFYRRQISIFVMVTFTILLCFWANQTPAAPAVPASEKSSTAARASGEDESPGFIEEEESEPVVKKGKKFPWLLVGVGVVAVGALIVLLAKKKSTTPDTPTGPYSNGVLTINGVRYDMASIPSGEFQMGSTSSDGDPDEQPVHTVRITKGFWLGKTEVTQGLWQAVMGSNPSYFGYGDNYPVEMVSWDDCQTFITKLNQLVGGTPFRLPTEAEWEYACRAGTTGDRYGDLDSIAWWYYNNSGNSTQPVGQKQPNAFGLYDILGNVWEWCQDWYGPYAAGYQTDPPGAASGTYRVFRGGDCYSDTKFARSAYRGGDYSSSREHSLGFRLAANSSSGG